jgi:hypothetical protein
MHRHLLVLVNLMMASQALAQTGSVSGIVYDSVARAPIRGAVVQMVPPSGAPLFTASSDARGRYAIADVPAGRYFIDFVHGALDSLALEPPLRAVEVRPGESAQVDLFVPAPASIIQQTCQTSPGDSLGLFFGILRDTRSGIGLDSGHVSVRWFELVIDASGMNRHERFASSATNREGWFGMCRVPANTEVVVQGSHGSDSTGMTIVNVPGHGLRRFDLDIGGVAAVRGRIVSRGRPVYNARVRVGSEERAIYTDSSGAYRIGAVPAGTQTVDVRALGYAPETKAITLAPDSETVIDLELTTIKRVMDTIQVVAQRLYSTDALGFERRQRRGGGTFFDSDDARRRASFSVVQLLQEVPTLRVAQSGFEKQILFRMGSRYCVPAFFLNGVMMPSDLLAELDLFVRPQELEGMEVYRNNLMPAEFMSANNCGAIVVWTKRVPRKR